jgi:hypothetical protein
MSTQTPTHKQFRDLALSHGYTSRPLAPHVEADEPVKTATRILVLLTGTRWDDEPLPYPKLCRLHHGQVAASMAAVSPLTPNEETAWIEWQFRTWAPERITRYYEQAALQRKIDHAPKLAKAPEKLIPIRTDAKRCQCGYRKKVSGRAKYPTAACQRRAHRQREKVA